MKFAKQRTWLPVDICRYCSGPMSIERQKRHAIVCSKACASKQKAADYRRENGDRGSLSTGTTGALAELVVGADLLRRGYAVYRALSPSAPCDLIILQNGKMWRVEVRSAKRGLGERIFFGFKAADLGRHDILALYFRGENSVEYRGLPTNEIPEADQVAQSTSPQPGQRSTDSDPQEGRRELGGARMRPSLRAYCPVPWLL